MASLSRFRKPTQIVHRAYVLSIACAAMFLSSVRIQAAPPAADAAQTAKIERFLGVYQAVPYGSTLPGGLHPMGDLKDLSLTPTASELQKSVNLKWDAARNCRIVGPVRMMARDDTRFELAPSLNGGLIMIYKNASLGGRRTFNFAAEPPKTLTPFWVGHSVAQWKNANTFLVQTSGFNDRTWLNSLGAPHSDALHVTEEYVMMPSGDLRLTMTIDDPKMLAKPFTYVRFFQRQNANLGELFCEEEFRQNP